MPTVRNTPSLEDTAVASKPKPRTATSAKDKRPATKKEMPASRKRAVAVSGKPATALVPEAPESKKAGGNKRKRLSKVFSRPLDKKLKQGTLVRDCFTFPEAEYAHLVGLKKRFLAEGIIVKKSELVRAGLALLASLDDGNLKNLLAKVPRVG